MVEIQHYVCLFVYSPFWFDFYRILHIFFSSFQSQFVFYFTFILLFHCNFDIFVSTQARCVVSMLKAHSHINNNNNQSNANKYMYTQNQICGVACTMNKKKFANRLNCVCVCVCSLINHIWCISFVLIRKCSSLFLYHGTAQYTHISPLNRARSLAHDNNLLVVRMCVFLGVFFSTSYYSFSLAFRFFM